VRTATPRPATAATPRARSTARPRRMRAARSRRDRAGRSSRCVTRAGPRPMRCSGSSKGPSVPRRFPLASPPPPPSTGCACIRRRRRSGRWPSRRGSRPAPSARRRRAGGRAAAASPTGRTGAVGSRSSFRAATAQPRLCRSRPRARAGCWAVAGPAVGAGARTGRRAAKRRRRLLERFVLGVGGAPRRRPVQGQVRLSAVAVPGAVAPGQRDRCDLVDRRRPGRHCSPGSRRARSSMTINHKGCAGGARG
jgi:hypothetical protein